MINNEKVIQQIQYYLSDKNLQNDEFFYKEVSANKQHFVTLKCFLNCNKVKKLGVTKVQQLIDAVKQSKTLQLNADQNMLRRKDLQKLPEFKITKKVKKEQNGHQQQEQEANPFQDIEPVIFCLSVDKDQPVPFRYIQQALLKTHGVYSPYTRFNRNEGNIAVNKKQCGQQIIDKLQKEGIKVGETLIKIKKASQEQLNTFWQKHGHHYSGIIDNLKKDHKKKVKQQKRIKKMIKISQFQFGGQKYSDINKLKSLFKNILCRNPNNVPLKQSEAKLVKELLAFHDKAQEKLKGFKHFVVDVNPNYIDTRCFYIVRDDNTREDFSVLKCINNVEAKYAVK